MSKLENKDFLKIKTKVFEVFNSHNYTTPSIEIKNYKIIVKSTPHIEIGEENIFFLNYDKNNSKAIINYNPQRLEECQEIDNLCCKLGIKTEFKEFYLEQQDPILDNPNSYLAMRT